MVALSWITGFKILVTSRRKSWDNVELDVLESFKAISFIMLMIVGTAFYLICSATTNTWHILDFFRQPFFTFVLSTNTAIEVFFMISAFLSFYRLT